MGDNSNFWSDEALATLMKEYEDGLTASQIARVLNEKFKDRTYTRNAVIGKTARTIHKEKRRPKEPLQASARPLQKAKPSKPSIVRQALAVQAQRRKPPPSFKVIVEPVPTGLIGVLELTSTTCRWPIGDPGTNGFHFCGAHMEIPFSEATPNTAYCEFHAKIAYAGLNFARDPLHPRLPFKDHWARTKVA